MDIEEYLATLAADEEIGVNDCANLNGFRVITSSHVPESEIQFREPQSGRLVGKINLFGRQQIVVPV